MLANKIFASVANWINQNENDGFQSESETSNAYHFKMSCTVKLIQGFENLTMK